MAEANADIDIPILAIFILACSQDTGMEAILAPYVIHDNHGMLFGPFSLRSFDPSAAKFGQPYFTKPEYAERYIGAVSSRKRRWMAEALVSLLTQLRACMRVLASSPIMVDTGFMVPKYQLRSVADQQNYNANFLTQQELFHARVKTLHGESTIRLSPPRESMRPELVKERISYIKQRMRERAVTRPAADIAEELRKRHEFLRGEATDAPPARTSTATRRPRRRIQRDDREEN